MEKCRPTRESTRFPSLPAPHFVWHKGDVKTLTEHLWFEVPNRRGFVNITQTVEDLVRKSGVQEGLCLVNAMHITASVFINDAEDGLLHDYDVWLEKLAPHAPTKNYQHNLTGEDNADAHHETPDHGLRSRGGHHERETGFRPVGADFLRRIRRQPPQARAGENYWGIVISARRWRNSLRQAMHPSKRRDPRASSTCLNVRVRDAEMFLPAGQAGPPCGFFPQTVRGRVSGASPVS